MLCSHLKARTQHENPHKQHTFSLKGTCIVCNARGSLFSAYYFEMGIADFHAVNFVLFRIFRLKELLAKDDVRYREESDALEETVAARLKRNRAQIKAYREKKEAERLQFVQAKYMQQLA